eukprot:115102-Rhodomonas_salina.1
MSQAFKSVLTTAGACVGLADLAPGRRRADWDGGDDEGGHREGGGGSHGVRKKACQRAAALVMMTDSDTARSNRRNRTDGTNHQEWPTPGPGLGQPGFRFWRLDSGQLT